MSNSTAVLDGQRANAGKETMHALVYGGPNKKEWTEVPKPQLLHDTDAIVRVDITTICGSDLHILKGDVPEVNVGLILVTRRLAPLSPWVRRSSRSKWAIASWCRASPRAASAATAVKVTSVSASRAGDGFWDISSTGLRPSSYASRSVTPQRTRCPRASLTKNY